MDYGTIGLDCTTGHGYEPQRPLFLEIFANIVWPNHSNCVSYKAKTQYVSVTVFQLCNTSHTVFLPCNSSSLVIFYKGNYIKKGMEWDSGIKLNEISNVLWKM